MRSYDVIIIGSGIGGTGVGALLAYKGLKILLLEKHAFIGGRCSSYKKEGFTVSSYVHAFSSSDKGALGEILRKIEMPDEIDWVQQSIAPLNFKGTEINIPVTSDIKKFLEVVKQMPIPPEELDDLLKVNMSMVSLSLKKLRALDNIDIRSWLSQYTSNKFIHTMMAFLSGASFVIPYYEASTSEYIRIIRNMITAGHGGYPRGDCIAIPQAYCRGIEKYKGTIRLDSGVQRILVENNEIIGVELINGEVIKAKIIISNAGIKNTVLNLIGEKHFDKNYVDYVKQLKYSWSAIVLKIALDKKITDKNAFIYFPTDNPTEYFRQIEKEGQIPESLFLWVVIPSNLDPSLAPPGKQLICCGSPLPYSKQEDWKKWLDQCYETLVNLIPDIPKHQLWIDTVTPTDIERMVGEQGAVIGIAQTTDQVGEKRPPIKSPLKGLYFVGAEAGGWGIGTELAANSALECAKIVLNELKM
ncbi:MAG: NAD(P)/FAD-dependent oxidoreductase [Candidatus Helarchaeota archaeon]|nr:NAD(P)/FAD-dependent oxidoreductase [Candidatus Helarchaeota archaeon]